MRRPAVRLVVPLLLLGSGLLVAGSPVVGEEAAPEAFFAQGIPIGVSAGGCDVGDLDPKSPGHEIAVVSSDGGIHLVRCRAGVLGGFEIARVPGEMIQCAIGDADPTCAGNELVAVGMAQGDEGSGGKGAAYVVSRGSDWRAERVFEDDALLHGVCVADLDPQRAGQEILVDGFSGRATVLAREGAAWIVLASLALPGPGKAAVAHGAGAAIACQDGSVVRVRKTGAGWTADVLVKLPSGAARLASDGTRLLVATDGGALVLWDGTSARTLHAEERKLRGAVLGDLDPSSPGLEAATAGYSGDVTFLRTRPDGSWSATRAWHGSASIHHLVAGELLAEGKGPELVVCDTSGRVTVIGRR